jgi:hypothetical protein
MFEDLFLVVYGLTVAFYFICFTAGVLRGKWDKKMVYIAKVATDRIEADSGHRFSETSMRVVIEATTIIFFLLPFVNTIILVRTTITKHKARKAFATATRKVVDDHTKFLDD